MYIPNNATSISIAVAKLIIFVTNRRKIVPARAVNETAMAATVISVLFLGMGYAGSLDDA